MVEQRTILWLNSGTVKHLMVEQSNRDGGTVEDMVV